MWPHETNFFLCGKGYYHLSREPSYRMGRKSFQALPLWEDHPLKNQTLKEPEHHENSQMKLRHESKHRIFKRRNTNSWQII